MSVSRMLPAVLLVHMVLLGGTSIGELHPVVRLITHGIVLGVVIAWTRGPARAPDRLDGLVVISLLMFMATGLLSQFMRQSFDAVWIAVGFASALAVGRRALFDPAARKLLLSAMAALSLLLAIVTAARWLPTTVAWVIASGGLAPPLDIGYPSAPWGHRHDVTLLLVMLAPAWLSFIRYRSALLMAGIAWTLTGVIVVLDGSRNLWLAIAIASLLAARSRWGSRVLTRRVLVPFAVIGVTVALVVSLALLDRLLNLRTIAARNELWDGAIQAWLATPLVGQGPGSFPWILQTTDYFATNAWAPRHPDSAIFQLLPEAGLLGLAAVIVLLVAIVPRLRLRTQSGWALTVFLVACLGANPTDFGFLIAVAIAWLALGTALPHNLDPAHRIAAQPRREVQPVAIATISLLIVAGTAQVSAFLGEVASWRAGDAIAAGDLETAGRDMDFAVALDPSLAFYYRIEGLIEWARSGPETAIPALREAVRINSSDDLAWRQLATAQWQSGDDVAALQSVETALRLQRSDVLNMLLAAQIASDAGRPTKALSLLGETVQAWPTLASAPSWATYLGTVGLEDADVIDEAIERWRLGKSSPAPVRTQPIWLAAIGHRPDLRDAAVDSTSEPKQLSEALSFAVTCDAPATERALADADPSSVYRPLYWQIRVARTSLPGIADDPQAVAVVNALSGDRSDSDASPDAADVLAEGTAPGFSIDNWGYRRRAAALPGLAGRVPLPQADWTLDLAGAARCES